MMNIYYSYAKMIVSCHKPFQVPYEYLGYILGQGRLPYLWQKEASDKYDTSCKKEKNVSFTLRQWNIMMSYQ